MCDSAKQKKLIDERVCLSFRNRVELLLGESTRCRHSGREGRGTQEQEHVSPHLKTDHVRDSLALEEKYR